MAVLLTLLCVPGYGDVIYTGSTYQYDDWGQSAPGPAAYEAGQIIDGAFMGAGKLNDPQDLYVDAEGKIYLADAGNKRVLCLDENWQLQNTLTGYTWQGQYMPFQYPCGLYVDGEGKLYVCDSARGETVILNEEGQAMLCLGRPETDLLADTASFKPTRVVSDTTGTIYVACFGLYQGLVTYDFEGNFTGFFGANRVTVTAEVLASAFWKSIFSQEQAQAMTRIIPTEYASIYIDKNDFIYAVATSTDDSRNELKKLNALGNNILRYVQNSGYYAKNNYGDLERGSIRSKTIDSRFVDVHAGENGVIAILDAEKGRVFLYDQQSNLLSIFGGSGSRRGSFLGASALEKVGDNYAVLDKEKNAVTIFRPTRYGKTLLEALSFYSKGFYQQSMVLWQQLLEENAGLSLAYTGIGKALYQEGEYEESLSYFEKAHDREGYSRAYREVRKEYIRNNLIWMLPLAAAALWGMARLIRLIRVKAGLAKARKGKA